MENSSDEKKNKLNQETNVEEDTTERLEDQIAHLARQLLVESQIYKQTRMNRIALYEALYNNDVPPKLRQMFNVIPPVFSGMVDSLLAQFNDEVKLKFKAINPAQYLVTPKIQAHWDAEKDSTSPNAMWNYKARTDRFNAVLAGRGIFEEYAYNDPEYTNVLKVINYSDFHCQPLGGGLLENHTFAGKEGCFKTKHEIQTSDKYDKEQVRKLMSFGWSNQHFTNLETTYGTKFTRWKALGLNPETNSFSGVNIYNLCDFIVTWEDGKRYNVVFEPCSGLWLYCKPWKETCPSGRYPWKSYATHEDDKNFWSKSYADDFYNIADAIIIMVNQELTNREKKNFNARAYDKDMFTDVAKLDAAQYRPDTLVPANTNGGTKRIAEGIYHFETPQLSGTVDLVNWLTSYTADKVGTDELPPGAGKAKVAIQIAQQQKQSKRIGLRADSFKECYAQLGEAYVEGLREYMPPKVSVQIIGENGFVEEQELKRIEVKGAGKISISVNSTSEQEQADAMKKEGRIQAIKMVAENPNLTKYEKETIYRDIGQYSEDEIMFLLDTKGEISKKQIAHASKDIQDILLGKEVDVYYGADLSYLNYIKQYLIDHKSHVMGKEEKFAKLVETMAPIVEQNAMSQANQPQPMAQQEEQTKTEAPAPSGKVSLPAEARKMAKVAGE